MGIATHIGTVVGQGDGSASPLRTLKALKPHDWWDFTDSNSLTLSGTNITSVANNGVSSDALAHVSGAYITHDGSKGVCAGSQNNYVAGTTGERNFLHDGSGGEVFIIHKQAASSNEQFLIVTNDIAGSSHSPGLRLSTFQTGGASYYISRIGITTNHYFGQSDDKTLTTGTPMISDFRVNIDATTTDDIVLSEDGVGLNFQSDAGLLVTNDHSGPLKALVAYTGDVYGILTFDRILSDAERARVHKALRSYYGLERQANITMLIGASNAAGLGLASALSTAYQGIIASSYIYAHRDGNASNPIAWYPHEQANGHVDVSNVNAGLDLSLMSTLVGTSSAKEFLVKATDGGSDLYALWNPDDQPSFATAWDTFAARLAAAASALRAIGFIPTYRGCIIGLGENDAGASFRADDYEDNQTKLNARVRGLTRPDLPIVLVNCSTELPTDVSGRGDGLMGLQATVRAAQAAVALAETHTVTYQPITTGTLAWNEATPNGVHFDMASLEQMGVEIAALI